MNNIIEKSKPPSLIFLLTATMVGIFATNLYIPSLPQIVSDLNTSSQFVQLSLSVFLLSFGLCQLIHGPLSDQIGRKVVLMLGLIIFIGASFFASLAQSVDFLILMRILQAFSSSSGMVVARAMVRDVYQRNESASIMSLVAIGSGISAAAAPIIGGVLQDLTGDWRFSFYFLALFAAFPLAIIVFFVGETHNSKKKTTIDLLSTMNGFRQLIFSKNYMYFTLGSGMLNGCFFAFATAAPFIIINSLKESPSRIGIILLFITIGFIAGNIISSRLSLKSKLESIVLGGTYICFFGILLFAFLAFIEYRSELSLSLPMMIYGFGSGLVIPSAGIIAVSIKTEIAGTGSALYGFNIFFIGSISTFIASFIEHNDQRAIAIIMLAFSTLSILCFVFGIKKTTTT